jgi:hypothetical protein
MYGQMANQNNGVAPEQEPRDASGIPPWLREKIQGLSDEQIRSGLQKIADRPMFVNVPASEHANWSQPLPGQQPSPALAAHFEQARQGGGGPMPQANVTAPPQQLGPPVQGGFVSGGPTTFGSPALQSYFDKIAQTPGLGQFGDRGFMAPAGAIPQQQPRNFMEAWQRIRSLPGMGQPDYIQLLAQTGGNEAVAARAYQGMLDNQSAMAQALMGNYTTQTGQQLQNQQAMGHLGLDTMQFLGVPQGAMGAGGLAQQRQDEHLKNLDVGSRQARIDDTVRQWVSRFPPDQAPTAEQIRAFRDNLEKNTSTFSPWDDALNRLPGSYPQGGGGGQPPWAGGSQGPVSPSGPASARAGLPPLDKNQLDWDTVYRKASDRNKADPQAAIADFLNTIGPTAMEADPKRLHEYLSSKFGGNQMDAFMGQKLEASQANESPSQQAARNLIYALNKGGAGIGISELNRQVPFGTKLGRIIQALNPLTGIRKFGGF